MNIELVLRRMLQTVVVLIGVSVVVFLIMYAAPGDPVVLLLGSDATPEQAELFRSRLGLDQPAHVQYLRWMGEVLQGNLGTSLYSRRPVSEEILPRFANTAILTVAALVIALGLGMILGILGALYSGTPLDRILMIGSVAGWSMPPFWLGLVLIIVFSVQLGWFPTGGMYVIGGDRSLSELARHLVLPAVTLGARHMSYIARLTRASMLEVLGQDYIRTARAKGLVAAVVILRHALRNSLIPVMTVAGVTIGRLLGGAVIVESVFAWPGLGSLIVRGISNRDFPLVQGAILFSAFVFVMVNFLVDLLYTVVDPRIRYT
jgi:peptide/nickel transport system permease protein